MRITIDGFSTYTRGTVRLDQMEDVIRHIDTTILQSALYLQNKPNLHPWMPIKYRRIFLAQFKYLIIFSIYFKIYNFIVFILTTLYYSKTEISVTWRKNYCVICGHALRRYYTGCNRRNGPDFGRVFLRSYYVYRCNPKHLYPKFNVYGDIGQRSLKLWQLLLTYWLPNTYWNWQEYVVSVMLISVHNIKVTREWHKAIK